MLCLGQAPSLQEEVKIPKGVWLETELLKLFFLFYYYDFILGRAKRTPRLCGVLEAAFISP